MRPARFPPRSQRSISFNFRSQRGVCSRLPTAKTRPQARQKHLRYVCVLIKIKNSTASARLDGITVWISSPTFESMRTTLHRRPKSSCGGWGAREKYNTNKSERKRYGIHVSVVQLFAAHTLDYSICTCKLKLNRRFQNDYMQRVMAKQRETHMRYGALLFAFPTDALESEYCCCNWRHTKLRHVWPPHKHHGGVGRASEFGCRTVSTGKLLTVWKECVLVKMWWYFHDSL